MVGSYHKAAKVKVLSILTASSNNIISELQVYERRKLTIQYIVQHLARMRMKIELPLKWRAKNVRSYYIGNNSINNT